MKAKPIVLGLLALSFISTVSASARFAALSLKDVPVARVLTNLQARLDKNPGMAADGKASLEFQIGRLHSMAYAQRTETARVDKGDSLDVTPNYGYGTDYNQFQITQAADPATLGKAKEHLAQAIVHLRNATKLDPSLEPAKLGLAWCLDQSGDKAAALPLYREVFHSAYEKEKGKGGLRGRSVGMETADYLLVLLNPTKDAAEIADIKVKRSQLDQEFRAITPIVVPLHPGVDARAMMQPCSLRFDLDGSGPRHFDQWPSSQAGWLVYDGRGSGSITSGLQMFGQSTFWVFWRDGYDALSALDANDDGVVQGRETEGLAVWSDTNCNGISERHEVHTLRECGIEALSCRGQLSSSGMPYSKNGVRFTNGGVADSVDWILQSGPAGR